VTEAHTLDEIRAATESGRLALYVHEPLMCAGVPGLAREIDDDG
jgi:hypothetical protein